MSIYKTEIVFPSGIKYTEIPGVLFLQEKADIGAFVTRILVGATLTDERPTSQRPVILKSKRAIDVFWKGIDRGVVDLVELEEQTGGDMVIGALTNGASSWEQSFNIRNRVKLEDVLIVFVSDDPQRNNGRGVVEIETD